MKRVAFLVALSGLACERAHFYSLQAGQGGGGGGGTGGTCAAPTLRACESQIAAEAPCDPVCQVGSCNWCTEKCSYDWTGKAACLPKGTFITDAPCTISGLDLPSQHDDCVEANICLPNSDYRRSYCFKTCRSFLECLSGSACRERTLNASRMVSVCDPPYNRCDPSVPDSCCNPIDQKGCAAGRSCYLVSPDPLTTDSRTTCDFPTGASTTSCALVSDCFEGWSCSLGTCHKICDPTVTSSCPNGAVCLAQGKQYGFCS